MIEASFVSSWNHIEVVMETWSKQQAESPGALEKQKP